MALPHAEFDTPTNRLLALLPGDAIDAVLAVLEPIDLALGTVLIERDQRIEHVYFPERALVAMLGADERDAPVAVAMVGRDGMVGLPLFFGVDRTFLRAVVQVAGSGWRMSAQHFRALLHRSVALDRILRRYAQAAYFFAAQSSACAPLHSVAQRCARWLLTTADALGASQFPVTHLVLAQMLGVRRATVTEAAGMLQRAGLIAYHRGTVRILHREGLERVSCPCYAIIRGEREQIMTVRETARTATGRRFDTGRSSAGDGSPVFGR